MADAPEPTVEQPLATEDTFLAAYTQRRAGRQYDHEILTFRLADEVYGLDMSHMREISKLRPLTELPRVPAFLLGIIAVRGVVVPIIDLRRRIGLHAEDDSRNSRILIVSHEDEPFGLIVDQVLKVVRLEDSQVEAAPLPGGIESDYLAGVARFEGAMIVLLNLSSVLQFSIEASR